MRHNSWGSITEINIIFTLYLEALCYYLKYRQFSQDHNKGIKSTNLKSRQTDILQLHGIYTKRHSFQVITLVGVTNKRQYSSLHTTEIYFPKKRHCKHRRIKLTSLDTSVTTNYLCIYFIGICDYTNLVSA
jgi:hypothetical protein